MSADLVVVMASRRDAAAAKLVASMAGHGLCLMTPADLSQEGWRLRHHQPAASIAMLGERRVAAADIAGVVTRLPAVDAGDLPQIAPSDRAYVAAEMTAFLLAWLTGLTCPVLNRPTPQCLSGPLWGRERWALAAAKLGIPARPVLRRAVWPKDDAEAAHGEQGPAVTVVGRSHIGIVDDVLAARAHRLARAAGVDLLSVEFDGRGPDARFVAASLWPDVGDARIAEPMMALLRDRTAGRIGDRRA